jgi:prepilin-type N-terminal cleavage/methylation domain-containing protein
MQRLYPKLCSTDRGFTMIEAIVAMTIVTAIIGVSIQLLLAATIHRIIAREKAEATTWIEADLELVKFRASQYSDNTICNATAIDAGYAQGFRDADLSVNGLGGATTTLTKTLNGKNFQVIRSANPRSATPYHLLELRYQVNSPTGIRIASLYTEVIPDAALRCR